MSLLKRIVSVATILTVVLMVAGPAVRPASALTVEELQAQIAALQEQLAAYQQQLQDLLGDQGGTTGGTIEGIPEGFTFDRNLKMGMTGDDVKYLQIVLNSDPDTKLADEGAGSPGNETTYFGPRTKAAVIKFQEKYADDVLAPWGLTHGSGFVGSTTRAKLNEILSAGGGTTPPAPTCSDYTTEEDCTNAGCYWYEDACHEEEQPAPTETGLTVALADDTPAAGVLVAGQGLADLAHFTFTNGDADEVKVTQLKVKRGGVSSDTAITYLYLYKDGERLTDPVTLSSSYATFNDPTGLFKVPAGESVTVAIKADIASSISGQIVQVSIDSADDVSSDATAVNGEFPLTGNQMSVASGSLAEVDFNASTLPTGSPSVDPGETGYTVWKNTANVTTRSVYLKYLRLKEIGSIDSDDLQNFKLYVNGVEVAGPVQMSDDFYVTFDLTSNPVTLETGSRIIEVRADVIDGSGKSFSFSLWYTADVVLEDSQYNVALIPSRDSSTFTPATTGTVSVNSGSLSIVRATDSPSGTVVLNGSGVTLAKYTLTAYGENIKIMSLKVKFASSDGSVGELRNGKLFADGVQVGPTQDITTSGVTFNLGSSLIVQPGSPVTLEVKADIYDSDSGGNDLTANDTITITLMEGSNNAQRMTSMTLLDAPESDKDAYTVTAAEGTLTLVKNSAYADQTIIPGTTAYKIGSYVLTSANEDVTLNQFTVGVTATDDGEADAHEAAVTDLSNLYVVYGDNQTSPKATVSVSNPFTLSYEMTSGTQLVIDIYADISSIADPNDTYNTTLAVSGTATVSGNVASASAVTGQTITIGEATLTAALDTAGTPNAQIALAGSTDVLAAKFKWSASNADITVKDAYIKLVDPDVANTVISASLDLNEDGTPDTTAVYPVLTSYTTGTAANDGTTITVPTGKGAEFTQYDKIVVTYGNTSVNRTINSISGDVLTLDSALPEAMRNQTVYVGSYIFPFTGGSLLVPKNGSTVVGVYLNLNDVSNNGDSGDDVKVALIQHKYVVNGNEQTAYVAEKEFTGIAANSVVVRKSYPTFELADLTSGTLADGTVTIAKFTVTAEGGDVALKKLTFDISLNDADGTTDLSIASPAIYDAADPGTAINATFGDGAGGDTNYESTGKILVSFDTEQLISAGNSKTYILKATISNSAQYDSVMTRLSSITGSLETGQIAEDTNELVKVGDVADDAFVWSDMSAGGSHSDTLGSSSSDWTNGYLVKTLPSDYQTLSR